MSTIETTPAALDSDPGSTSVGLFDLALRMPGDVSLRLDQPCLARHGSLGGWRRVDGSEVTCTLLWRPLAYWAGDDAAPGEDPRELQSRFVEHALARTRRDGLAVEVLARDSGMRVAGHGGEVVDVSIGVRRRMTRMRLRRRQALWTCPDSGRHLAFEVSAQWEHRELVDDAFASMVGTLGCHGRGGPR